MIAIVKDCGTNVASLVYALERIGKTAIVTNDAEIIETASHVILPGVSSATRAMAKLKENNLTEIIKNLKQPVLGICSGMQILFSQSEEGMTATLDIIPGQVKKLMSTQQCVLPHMGWNRVCEIKKNEPLFEDVPDDSYVYYVHSFAVACLPQTIAQSSYAEIFSAAVLHKNFYGVQFHPERSGKIGENILNNFVNL
ncbi:imidazole glycerol phosphate synthase subunit HisH [Candidatus Berkiella cookevillensis]|uniref:Imidazole glycerol phosphate synthase subunit HisH n=1 Tax=Candidatus Berkiella cookevillensis TaxID=437022 RepID=A0A0Q9YCN8_9GAMM|nr:imidazole glycerol phosphate synthase subunit HisH [Candidatus Berkiella cookevillensis]MCS5708111.1 imidazole glycerol phosphate synthase subunit HisH [Candidatus Berkiella cookevillensis]